MGDIVVENHDHRKQAGLDKCKKHWLVATDRNFLFGRLTCIAPQTSQTRAPLHLLDIGKADAGPDTVLQHHASTRIHNTSRVTRQQRVEGRGNRIHSLYRSRAVPFMAPHVGFAVFNKHVGLVPRCVAHQGKHKDVHKQDFAAGESATSSDAAKPERSKRWMIKSNTFARKATLSLALAATSLIDTVYWGSGVL